MNRLDNEKRCDGCVQFERLSVKAGNHRQCDYLLKNLPQNTVFMRR
ncbi:hypothetical protein VCR20J5_300179 [Vibrio crassostreae]|nr:hypothetical protein VCR20J5_300179 [Vibrio crassostreae]